MCESTIYLDDIDMPVLYSRNKRPHEIPDKLAKKSKVLEWALDKGMLVDVTNGVPENLPKPKDAAQWAREVPRSEGGTKVDPESPFYKRKSMLVEDDHAIPRGTTGKGDRVPQPPPIQKLQAHEESAAENYRNDGELSVVWTGPACDAGGYARMNRKFMYGLQERGVRVHYEHIESLNDMDAENNERLKALGASRVPKDALKIYGMTAPLIYDWSRYKALFTMMETRRLHPDYVERCNCSDEIIVPTHWCKRTFEESGVTKPISVVPLGVDTSIYHPGAEPIGFSRDLRDFVFLSVFGWSLRKGYDVLLKAYLEEFTSDEPVSLLISSRYFGSTHESKKKVIRDDVARVKGMVRNPRKPHVALFMDVLSDDMMPRLYAAADAYVLISRGEGQGLPFLESAACDVPVIASNYSGQTDFLDESNSYLVDVDGFRKAETSLAWISYFYEDAEFPIFGPKAIEQTRHLMRRVFENREEAAAKSRRLHDKITREYNWDACVDKMQAKLRDMHEAQFGERKEG